MSARAMKRGSLAYCCSSNSTLRAAANEADTLLLVTPVGGEGSVEDESFWLQTGLFAMASIIAAIAGIRPSAGVKLIVLAILRPASSAHMLAPLPRWSTTVLPCAAPAPTSSTMPMNSWPRMSPSSMPGILPR